MMTSTRELKDAVRLAQQYNFHIYRTLINGIVDSSIPVSNLKHEFEEYTRSSMMFFDRLYQISGYKIPNACIREEQIRVFIDLVKRNDILRQEINSIVQRSHKNLRVMGQSIPMANKHMIEQGFPELCVTTRSDKVPFTVLCDHVVHKYNLRNERHIVALLKMAEEEISSRMATHPGNKIFPSYEPTMNREQPVEQVIKIHGMTPVNSNEDIRRQPVPCFALTAKYIKKLYTQFHSLRDTATTYTNQIPVEQQHALTQNMSLTDESQQHIDDFTMSFNDGIDLKPQQINEAGGCTNEVIIREIESVPETKQTSTKAEMFDDVMSVQMDIPELDSDNLVNEAANISYQSLAETASSKPLKDLETVHQLVPANFHKQTLAMKNTSKTDVNMCLPFKKGDNVIEYIEQHHIKYDPRNRQVPLCSWEELVKRFTKPDAKDVSQKQHEAAPSDKAIDSVAKCLSILNSNGINIPEASPISDPNHVQNKQKHVVAKCEGNHNLPTITITSQVQKQLTKINQVQPLIGSKCPYVYADKIKRQQHKQIKNDTENKTLAKTVEFKKRRKEQMRALELTKEKTKNILNQQIGKSGREKPAIHYHKEVKVLDTVPKVGKVFKTPVSSGSSQQTNVQQAKQDKYVPSFINRKRPAAPSKPLSPSKRACRRLEPRIILRIFKDNNEWNVEQVLD